MGRTQPTFNMILQQEQDSWHPFRQALRKEDRPAFDRLFIHAKQHMAEGAQAARPFPFETALMCMLLEMGKELDVLRGEIDELRSHLGANRAD